MYVCLSEAETNQTMAVFPIIAIFAAHDLIFETGRIKMSELRCGGKEITRLKIFVF